MKQAVTNRDILWIHAVSVGEVNLATQLIAALERRQFLHAICFAHHKYVGFFAVLSIVAIEKLQVGKIATLLYKATDYYAPSLESSLRWNDPSVAIRWPLIEGAEPILSERDKSGLALAAVRNALP